MLTLKDLSTETKEALQEAVTLATVRVLNSDAVRKVINEQLGQELARAADEAKIGLDLNSDESLVAVIAVVVGERPYGRVSFTFNGELVK